MPSLRRRSGSASAALALLAAAGASLAGPDPPPARWGAVVLPTGRTISVEIADTPELIQRGYMFREKVPEGEGMIFFLGTLSLHPFWMKNCRTALDIIWIDEQWRIVHIAPSLPPCREDPCPSYTPVQKSLYVLEVGPGEAARLGLRVGDRVTYVPPAPAAP